MTLVIPLTHDQAVDAVLQGAESRRWARPRTDPLLFSVVTSVLRVHRSLPSETGWPMPECGICLGTGRYEVYYTAEPQHCHCRCPWCIGCEEPLCTGPCPTVAAIGAALGIEGITQPERTEL